MEPNNFTEFFKGRRIPVVVGILLVLLLSLVMMSLRGSSTNKTEVTPTPFVEPTVAPAGPFDETTSIKSPEVLQAIQLQMQADQEYASWQEANATKYPWLRKLPLTSDKYFVYFDLKSGAFVGKLYVAGDDDVEQLKSEIITYLKVDEEIPVDEFVLRWQINP